MSAFASTNLTGGRNPWTEKPLTPVFYDIEKPPDDPNYIRLGPGTQWQYPTQHLQHAVDVAWRWAFMRATVVLHIEPTLQADFGEVDASNPYDLEFDVDLFGFENPEIDATHTDFTDGTRPPFIGHYDAYAAGGQMDQIATYTTSMAVTGGFDSLFAAPVVDIVLSGCHKIFTMTADGPQFWMSGVSFRLSWRYFASGPGDPDGTPPVAAQPLHEVFSFPQTDADDNVMPLQEIRSEYELDAPYEGDDGDCVMLLGDELNPEISETACILRRFPAAGESSTVQGSVDIKVLKYLPPRKPI